MKKETIINALNNLFRLTRQNPEFKGCEKVDLARKHLEMPNHLLIMGEFKAGKSTLINTILGENVLKEGRTATTAVKTLIRYGPKRKVIKVMRDVYSY